MSPYSDISLDFQVLCLSHDSNFPFPSYCVSSQFIKDKPTIDSPYSTSQIENLSALFDFLFLIVKECLECFDFELVHIIQPCFFTLLTM